MRVINKRVSVQMDGEGAMTSREIHRDDWELVLCHTQVALLPGSACARCYARLCWSGFRWRLQSCKAWRRQSLARSKSDECFRGIINFKETSARAAQSPERRNRIRTMACVLQYSSGKHTQTRTLRLVCDSEYRASAEDRIAACSLAIK